MLLLNFILSLFKKHRCIASLHYHFLMLIIINYLNAFWCIENFFNTLTFFNRSHFTHTIFLLLYFILYQLQWYYLACNRFSSDSNHTLYKCYFIKFTEQMFLFLYATNDVAFTVPIWITIVIESSIVVCCHTFLMNAALHSIFKHKEPNYNDAWFND